MESAARQVYSEYQHSHNPQTPDRQWDYAFTCGAAATYVLDGRGHRDFNRKDNKILGAAQLNRNRRWMQAVDVAQTRKVEFKLYGRDTVQEVDVDVPGTSDIRPEAHPIANIELGF